MMKEKELLFITVFVNLVINQFFEYSRQETENRYWPVVRAIISLATFKFRGNSRVAEKFIY